MSDHGKVQSKVIAAPRLLPEEVQKPHHLLPQTNPQATVSHTKGHTLPASVLQTVLLPLSVAPLPTQSKRSFGVLLMDSFGPEGSHREYNRAFAMRV